MCVILDYLISEAPPRKDNLDDHYLYSKNWCGLDRRGMVLRQYEESNSEKPFSLLGYLGDLPLLEDLTEDIGDTHAYNQRVVMNEWGAPETFLGTFFWPKGVHGESHFTDVYLCVCDCVTDTDWLTLALRSDAKKGPVDFERRGGGLLVDCRGEQDAARIQSL